MAQHKRKGHASKVARKATADANKAARAPRSSAQQLERLDRGQYRAARERKRLS